MKIISNIISMESETVLTQYLITNWTLAYKDVDNVNGDPDDDRPQEEDLERHLDRLLAHHSRAHHRLRDQLLQGLLLRGDRHREPHVPPRPHHLVHQRLKQPAPDGRETK